MKYNLEGFSRRDAKLIRDNEGKGPAELAALGLSQAAFNKLIAQEEAATTAPKQVVHEISVSTKKEKPEAIKPTIVEPTEVKTGIIPQAQANAGKGQVWIKNPNGRKTKMGYHAAMRLVNAPGSKYQIVQDGE